MRKIEELLAARFPRPDVRDLVRRLPARARLTPSVERGSEQRPTEVPSCETTALRHQVFVESRPLDSRPREPSATNATNATNATKTRRLEPLSADRYGVHFTADGEFRELRVRDLAGHRLPGGDLMTLLKRGLEAYAREIEKERFAVGCKPRRSRNVAPAPAPARADRSALDRPKPTPSAADPLNVDLRATPSTTPNTEPRRRCPAAVARAVFLRDGRQCSYVSPDGRRCSARRCLELDHVNPRAVGGENTIENLRLRCRAHPPSGITKRVNQRYARQCFGKARVEAVVQRVRRQRAAPRQPSNR